MTVLSSVAPALKEARSSERWTPRDYLMCRPTYFTVDYTINPWMHTDIPVDLERALSQWESLRQIYLDLGHRVLLLEPIPGLPDMVFAANGGLMIDGTFLGARFRHAERGAEAPAFLGWFRYHADEIGINRIHEPEAINEGEGDFLVAGSRILAGTGFRTDQNAHRQVADLFRRPVETLELVDPDYYHLDTALTVLDDATIAYYPGAFSVASNQRLRELFPDAIRVEAADAAVLGLNAVSDGRHVVVCHDATGFARQLGDRGFRPIPVDVSELRKAGGGPKCATLEVRR